MERIQNLLYFFIKNNQYFYCLNRKQLEEYWGCIVKDQEVFCPEKCNKCVVCKFRTKTYDELKSACWVIQNLGQMDLVQLEVLVLLQKL